MAPKHSEFIPLKIAVLTVSDSRTAADDSSGDYLVEALTQSGHVLADRALCPDNLFRIRAQVSDWIADEGVQVVLINGGTGFNEQNRVPEAVGVLFERTVQGFGEMFRQLSFAEIKGSAMQSRALAGLDGPGRSLAGPRGAGRLPPVGAASGMRPPPVGPGALRARLRFRSPSRTNHPAGHRRERQTSRPRQQGHP